MEIEHLLWSWLVPGMYALLDMVALALALIYYRRCPAACGLVITGALFGLAALFLRWLINAFGELGPENRFAQSIVLLGLSGMNWIGYGLIIVAVFAGRRPSEPTRVEKLPDDDDDDTWGAPAAIAPQSTGIKQAK